MGNLFKEGGVEFVSWLFNVILYNYIRVLSIKCKISKSRWCLIMILFNF